MRFLGRRLCFAILLLLEDDETDIAYWQEAFQLLYYGSIEEIAAREDPYDAPYRDNCSA